MKHIQRFVIIILFIPCLAMSQEKIEFEILFGNYVNDHYKKEFHLKERKWALKNGKLAYLFDIHNERNSDTITLKSTDIQSILVFIKENDLKKSIAKNLKKDFLDKEGLTEIIKGNIKIKNENFNFNLKANSPFILDKDSDAQKLKKLEALLYKIIEN